MLVVNFTKKNFFKHGFEIFFGNFMKFVKILQSCASRTNLRLLQSLLQFVGAMVAAWFDWGHCVHCNEITANRIKIAN